MIDNKVKITKTKSGAYLVKRDLTKYPRKPLVNHSYDNFNNKWRACRFSLFIIRELSKKWKCSYEDVIKQLNEYNGLEDDLIFFYDILHTQGLEYVINSIEKQIDRKCQWIIKKNNI